MGHIVGHIVMVQTLTLAPTLASTLAMIGSDAVERAQPISTTSLQAQHSNPSLRGFHGTLMS
jgi:hypothetical protein